jgi:hypothetical protein
MAKEVKMRPVLTFFAGIGVGIASSKFLLQKAFVQASVKTDKELAALTAAVATFTAHSSKH